ncbi:hypothetical protein GUITHDRAFT_132290 [Guillardia theta CCMP2712]|uniref:protein O-GlcNAc transferase n=1 Tax=Guillardia theta (strain CCMP2712) TaxID=905079 RepID=L1K2B8_GUITC|nr:hypothetical protein GUITHDRAFT_132290 [Guillardia theta CCMP2712]EKX54595.1 hypothetical protein GUITHDRAFT_132290 [Guillardia theta CCMP2712]|eukprot:XP_005841575.1 hypothetical protein GUITHDRAFT_132290 [Guillardia theta CCMP2712]
MGRFVAALVCLLSSALLASVAPADGETAKEGGERAGREECLVPAEIEMIVEGMKLVYANEGEKASAWFKGSCNGVEEGKFADNCACHYWAFRSHTDVNKTEDADIAFRASLSLAPRDPMLRSIHAERLAQGHNFTEAADEFLLAAELFEKGGKSQDKEEDIMRNYYNAATSFVQVGRAEEAIAAYQKVVKTRKGKSKWAVYNSMGLLYYDMMKDEEAIYNFKLALSIERNHPAVLRNLAGVYLRANNASEAVELLRLSAEVEPSSFESWFYLGGAYARLEQHRAAAESFANATLINPNNSDAHRYLGEECFEVEEYKCAIDAMRTATSLISKQSLYGGCDVFSSLGRMLLELGRYADALTVLRTALHRCECTFHPRPDECKQDPWQLVDLGTAEMLLGLFAEANSSFSAAMEARNLTCALKCVMRACLLDLTAGIEDLSQVGVMLEEESSPPWMVQHLDVDQRRLARMTELYAMQSQEMRGADISALISILRVTTSNQASLRHLHETILYDWCKNPVVDSEEGEETSESVDFFDELGHRPNKLREVVIGRANSYEDARRINEDQVHVLVNLDGWKRRNRNEILAHRPCLLQVTALGHRGSMGSEVLVDFLLAGKISAPPELQHLYKEKLSYNTFGYLPPCVSRILHGSTHVTCVPAAHEEEKREDDKNRTVFGMFGPPQATSHELVKVVDESLSKSSNIILSLPPHPSLSVDKLAAIFPQLCSNRSSSHAVCSVDQQVDAMNRLGHVSIVVDTWSISSGPLIGQALVASKRIIVFPRESFASRTGAEHAIMMGCQDCAILRESQEFLGFAQAYGSRVETAGKEAGRKSVGTPNYPQLLTSPHCPWAEDAVRLLRVGLDLKLSTERPYHLVLSVSVLH